MKISKQKTQKRGSAFKNLKNNLAQLGIIGPAARKSKKGSKNAKIDEQKERREKLQQFTQRVNPFELKVNKQKYEVLGKAITKAEIGRPGVSRKRAQDTRIKTLKVQLDQKHNVNSFHDKRIGEGTDMSLEEKMMERFVREKKLRADKSVSFNIKDDDDVGGFEDELTHFGQSLSTIDVREHDPRMGDKETFGLDEMDESEMNFGGFCKVDQAGKSHDEIMQEIIAKSKMYRTERQRLKEEDEEIRQALNDDFADIRHDLIEASNKAEDEKKEKKILPAAEDNEKEESDLDYDDLVKSLVFEPRARVTDRLKTDEEIAKEEAERLIEMEKQRQARMRGIISNAEGDSSEIGGDDLHEDYALEESKANPLSYSKGKLVLQESEEEDESEEEGEGGDSDDEETEAEEIDFETDEDGEENGSGSEVDEETDTLNEDEDVSNAVETALPFSFEAPSSYPELVSLFQGRSYDDQSTLLCRMLVLYHPSLKVENKTKSIIILKVLFYHVESLAKYYSADKNDLPSSLQLVEKTIPVDQRSLGFQEFVQVLEGFLPCLFKLVSMYPAEFAALAQERSQSYYKAFCRRKKGKPTQPLVSFNQIIVISLFIRVFSTSDFFHPIATPTIVLLSQWLECLSERIESRETTENVVQDYVTGLFLCSLVRDFVKDSKRYIPQTVNFLFLGLKLMLNDYVKVDEGSLTFYQLSSDSGFKLNYADLNDYINPLSMSKKDFKDKSDFSFDCLINEESTPSKKSLLQKTFAIVVSFMKLYKEKEQADINKSIPLAAQVNPKMEYQWVWLQVFNDFFVLLNSIKDKIKIVKEVLEETEELRMQVISLHMETAEYFGSKSRISLQFQPKQQKSITFFNPKFEANYSLDKKYKTTESKRMQNEYKKEFKGAVRELKKDAAFLATEQITKKKADDLKYQAKIRKIVGGLSNEFNEGKPKRQRLP